MKHKLDVVHAGGQHTRYECQYCHCQWIDYDEDGGYTSHPSYAAEDQDCPATERGKE